MNTVVQIGSTVETKPPSLEELRAIAERVEKAQEPLLAKIQAGALAYDRISQNCQMKLAEINYIGVPIEVVWWMPPKHIVLLDREGHVIKTLECE